MIPMKNVQDGSIHFAQNDVEARSLEQTQAWKRAPDEMYRIDPKFARPGQPGYVAPDIDDGGDETLKLKKR